MGDHGHHHHRKWYENQDGVQYHPVEWEAYKVGSKNLTKCVDLFIPYKHCVMDQGRSLMQSDFGYGKCSTLKHAYDECHDMVNKHNTLYLPNNAFFNDAKLASSEGVSNTFMGTFQRNF
mmetsp:Transcript_7436/g.6770  ORF Transcript_7436/g.6770 Transcript_7436/m.6770 type:complete len:119 (+) Transcript_7436:62-418(+)